MSVERGGNLRVVMSVKRERYTYLTVVVKRGAGGGDGRSLRGTLSGMDCRR